MDSVRINIVDVQVIDERTVRTYYFDKNDQNIASFDLTVEETEKYIGLIQNAV